ncbi:pilus assembly protein [Allohahella sp. A8]|uniref:pilus assembly protein n=1 Tax=Allohahella sp. A8 TaxID=3141461 RepID=UPI003A80E23B
MLNETLKTVACVARRSGLYTLASLVLLGPATQTFAAPLALSQTPLFIKKGVDPNIFVTFDDSGSMSWAFTPDFIGWEGYGWYNDDDEKDHIYRRFASPDFNAQYYNPDIIYAPPKRADGTSYSTSFTAAYINGFHPNVDGVTGDDVRNLSNDYRVQYLYEPSTNLGKSVPSQIKRHPVQEFGSKGTISKNGTEKGQAAYYYRYVLGECKGNKSLYDETCYKYVQVGSENNRPAAESQQNFANWYSFYRTRVFAAASAATLAFEAVGPTARLGFQALNRCNSFSSSCSGWTGENVDSRLRPFTGSHRNGLYKWLSIAPARNGTPLRSAMDRAGNEIARTGVNGAYAYLPGTTLEPIIECRPSYHMMFTDGVWNSDNISSYGNADNKSVAMPTGSPASEFGIQNYSPKAPYKDDYSNTLADIAFSQWITDAQPTIANKVPTFIAAKAGSAEDVFWNPRNDSAHWQHMTTFTVGLGFSATMTDPNFNGDTFGGDFTALSSGAKSWPEAKKDGNQNAYDLWHAAINGRGKFFSADDPNSLVESFRAVLQGIQDRTATAAAPASNSAIIQGAEFSYSASFNSEDWSGDLRAFALTETDGTLTVADTPTWSAQQKLGATNPNDRKILIANASKQLVPFKYSNLPSSQQIMMSRNAVGGTDALGESRVEWLRGSKAGEGTTFRSRGPDTARKLLGDIIYSTPLYVGPPSFLNLDKTEGLAAADPNSYAKFKIAQAARKPMVYVGANDGMLHAFDAATGQEEFAFVPSEVVPNLYKLSSPGYAHESFVDGELNSFDVYDPSSDTKWRTLLVGTLRGGGRSVFALDITNPLTPKLMWEVSGTQALGSTVRPELGFTYSKPQIGRLHNGRWGVILGNGYKSNLDRSRLLVLNALTGATIKTFDTGVGSPDDPNGMAEPLLADVNGDLIIDSVYAGDLHGHLWRFDLINTTIATRTAILGDATTPARINGTSLSQWKIAENKPLFTARQADNGRQSISSRPQLALHPFGDSYLVVFGTGRYLESGDALPNTTRVDSFYSVWDRSILDKTVSNGTFTRSNLQQQKLLRVEDQEYEVEIGGIVFKEKNTIKRVTTERVDWFTYDDTPPFDAPVVNERGWFLDFVEYKDDGTGKASSADPVNLGEMIMTSPIVRGTGADPIVFFLTATPLSSVCESGLENYIYGLTASGGAPAKRQFDLSNDGMVNSGDYNSSDAKYGSTNNLAAVKVANIGGFNAVGENLLLSTATGIDTVKTSFGASDGRQTWRQLR